MEDSIKYIASYLLAGATLFSGLFFWPLFRRWLILGDPRILWLRTVFFGHIILLLASFGLVYFYWASGNRDWLHSLLFPYAVGALSVVASLVVLFVGNFYAKRS